MRNRFTLIREFYIPKGAAPLGGAMMKRRMKKTRLPELDWSLPVEPWVLSKHCTCAQLAELVNLFHVGRTALSGEKDQSRWARMSWASGAFAKEHPEFTRTRAYKELSNALESGSYRGSDYVPWKVTPEQSAFARKVREQLEREIAKSK